MPNNEKPNIPTKAVLHAKGVIELSKLELVLSLMGEYNEAKINQALQLYGALYASYHLMVLDSYIGDNPPQSLRDINQLLGTQKAFTANQIIQERIAWEALPSQKRPLDG